MDLIKDLSVLTTIPTASLNKLVNKSNYCICYDVKENLAKGENVTSIDIGIGTLSIILDDDSVYYKFKPSKDLENSLKSTIVNGENPLINVVDNTIKDKILNVYKELF